MRRARGYSIIGSGIDGQIDCVVSFQRQKRVSVSGIGQLKRTLFCGIESRARRP